MKPLFCWLKIEVLPTRDFSLKKERVAKETLKQAKINKQVVPISSEKHQTLAPRPKRSVLGTSKIQSYLGISPRSWQEALGECLEQLIDG